MTLDHDYERRLQAIAEELRTIRREMPFRTTRRGMADLLGVSVTAWSLAEDGTWTVELAGGILNKAKAKLVEMLEFES